MKKKTPKKHKHIRSTHQKQKLYHTAINISTSIQLGFVMSEEQITCLGSACPPSLSFFPYFDGKLLALCAGLNGGNSLGYLAECIGKWIIQLGR